MTKKRHMFRLISCLGRQIFDLNAEIPIHNPNDTNDSFGVKPSAIRCQRTVPLAVFHRSQPVYIDSRFERNHCFQFSICCCERGLHSLLLDPEYNRYSFVTHAGTCRGRYVVDRSYMIALVSFMICSV